jgi:hypothetical protein
MEGAYDAAFQDVLRDAAKHLGIGLKEGVAAPDRSFLTEHPVWASAA